MSQGENTKTQGVSQYISAVVLVNRSNRVPHRRKQQLCYTEWYTLRKPAHAINRDFFSFENRKFSAEFFFIFFLFLLKT